MHAMHSFNIYFRGRLACQQIKTAQRWPFGNIMRMWKSFIVVASRARCVNRKSVMALMRLQSSCANGKLYSSLPTSN